MLRDFAMRVPNILYRLWLFGFVRQLSAIDPIYHLCYNFMKEYFMDMYRAC